ncbi:hypothetical protein, partial [Pseudomonas viridiflava]|uniref:hypothetical protein n=1 Tax=Pseudomonas viridiflava TaxID=33069 RepID=UPI0013CEAE27
LKVFMEQTGLDSDEVEKLLGVGSHTPYASPNILPDAVTGGPSRNGASYVNGLDAQESMSLVAMRRAPGNCSIPAWTASTGFNA